MKCRNCGEEYDNSLFPVCPFCLTYNDADQSNEAMEEINTSEIKDEMNIAEQNDSVIFINEKEIINKFNKELLRGICLKSSDTSSSLGKEKAESFERKNEDLRSDDICYPNADVSMDMREMPDIDIIDEKEVNKESSDENISLDDIIPMSVRLSNVLKRNNINTLEHLKKAYNSGDLMKCRNFGASCLSEVENILKEFESGNIDFNPGRKIDDRLTIEKAFEDGKYSLFRNYCQENHIKFVDEINSIDAFINQRGVGEAKVTALKEKLDELNVNYSITEEDKKIVINEELLGVDVGITALFGIKQTAFNAYNIKTLGDLKELVESDKGMLSRYYKEKFIELKDTFDMPFAQFFVMAINIIKQWERFDILTQRAKGYTLQEIGDTKSLSRERIRQIEGKYMRNMSPLMKAATLHIMGSGDYCSYDDFYKFTGNEEDAQIIIMWIKNSDDFVFIDYDDVIVKKENYIKFENEIAAVLENVVDSGSELDEIIPEIDSIVQKCSMDFFDENSLRSFIKEKGYYSTGKYIFTHKPSYGQLCSYLIEKYFPDGIKTTDENLDLLREYALMEYGDIGIPDENRPLIARLSDYTVLRDRSTFIAERSVRIDFALIEEIKEYIDSMKEDRIYYSELFSRFQGKLEMLSNVDNYNFLHGVLKYYYGSDYDFSGRDYIKKSGEGFISGVLSDKIKRIIEDNGKPLSRKELLNHIPGISNIVFFNALAADEDLIYWDTWQYYLVSLVKLDPADIAFIRSKMDDLVDYYKGYLSIYALYDAINTERPMMLKNAGIANENNLFYYLAKICKDDYSFRNPHIMIKGLEEKSTKEIVLNLLSNPDILDYRTYMDLAKRYKWSPVTAGIVFGEIESDYIRISKDEYKKKTDFMINSGQLLEIESVIKTHMTNGFMPMINLDLNIGLPDIGIDWNVYMLKSIIINYIPNLRIIEPNNKDRRFEKGIIVVAQEKAKSFEMFIANYLADKGLYKISERDLLSLLILSNFTIQTIPVDLYYGDSIKKSGDEFIVDVKGR